MSRYQSSMCGNKIGKIYTDYKTPICGKLHIIYSEELHKLRTNNLINNLSVSFLRFFYNSLHSIISLFNN